MLDRARLDVDIRLRVPLQTSKNFSDNLFPVEKGNTFAQKDRRIAFLRVLCVITSGRMVIY